MLMNKVRNVFLIAVIVAAVCAGGHLESVDQAQALGGASAETVESWNAWRRDNPGSVASAFPWADIPACFVEDGSVAVDGGFRLSACVQVGCAASRQPQWRVLRAGGWREGR